MKKVTPEEMLKITTEYADNLDALAKKAVFVGLPKEKVGGKIYGGENMTIIRIGAIHEYGAKVNHPGGTPYVIGSDGKAKFVKKGTAGAVGVTKPHTINIPQRSFLRAPFKIKAAEINKATAAEFEAVLTKGRKAEQALGRIGVIATNISKGAFRSDGYGSWPGLKPATIRAKGSSRTLIDTGTLRSSITWVVRDAS